MMRMYIRIEFLSVFHKNTTQWLFNYSQFRETTALNYAD